MLQEKGENERGRIPKEFTLTKVSRKVDFASYISKKNCFAEVGEVRIKGS